MSVKEMNQRGNRLEEDDSGKVLISAKKGLEALRDHPKSAEIEEKFASVFKARKANWQSAASLADVTIPDEIESGEVMSDKDQELALDDLGELELSEEGTVENSSVEEEGFELSVDEELDIDLSAPDETPQETIPEDSGLDLELSEELSFEESDDSSDEEELSLSDDEGDDFSLSDDEDLSLGAEEDEDVSFDLGGEEDEAGLDFSADADEIPELNEDLPNLDEDIPELNAEDASLDMGDDLSLDFSADSSLEGDMDLSDDAREKLKEIDAIMDLDASQVGISVDFNASLGDEEESLVLAPESDLETSLVSDDLNLDSISFSQEEEPVIAAKEEKPKKKSKENKEKHNIGSDLKEISGAYSGEMERMQATISNLRSDREELLAQIEKMEDEKVLQSRQTLSMRAELDEKKIELTIIRKKLNDEIAELKDRLKLHEEKKLILEEKNRILLVELDKAAQKNKIDVKKVQLRERELEQKLELLKSDAETQIRNRDLKILELKRKLDAMEFDIESISLQEKRSVESRFELEDKLDKAIKTLRNAITVLEDESEKSSALEALKKNIDM